MTRILVLVVALVTSACAAKLHSVQLVNRTNRVIEEIYIFPAGSAKQGASRGSLKPAASTTVKVKEGNVEVLAVSSKVRLDQQTTERRTASQTLELRGPLELVFHDSNQVPPGLDRKGVVGLTFRIDPPPAAPPSPEPDEPAPDEPAL